MTAAQARTLIQALNQMQPYVPPIVFGTVADTPVASALAAIASGTMRMVPGPPQMISPESTT